MPHLPTYKNEGIEVVGVFDLDQQRAQEVASEWGVETVFANLSDAMCHDTDVIYDLAPPPGSNCRNIEACSDRRDGAYSKANGIKLCASERDFTDLPRPQFECWHQFPIAI